jgi:hypothetical protein
VAWSLWGCLAFRLPVNSESVKAIGQSTDSTIVLLALDCEEEGLLTSSLDKALWESLMTHESLYDENWLFTYEANIKGWLNNASSSEDFVSADKNFDFLKKHDVHFYEKVRPAANVDHVPIPPTPMSFFEGLDIAAYVG